MSFSFAMTWILFLEPFTECAQFVRKRTDTTLDQDCVLKVTVQVRTACVDVLLLTTCMTFNTPPLAQVAPFDARFANQTRKKERLPTQSVQVSKCPEATTTAHVPSQPGPEKASALSVILARRWGTS